MSDNCPDVADLSQSDSDADGIGDTCDDRDSTAWSPVEEASGLRVTKEGSLFVLTWDSQALTAGSGTRYDVVESALGRSAG